MLAPALPPVPRSFLVGRGTSSRTAAPVMLRGEIHIADESANTRFRVVHVHEQTNHPLAIRDASDVTVILCVARFRSLTRNCASPVRRG